MHFLGRFPFLKPILRFFISRSKRGVAMETLQGIARTLIEERRQTGNQGKVSTETVTLSLLSVYTIFSSSRTCFS